MKDADWRHDRDAKGDHDAGWIKGWDWNRARAGDDGQRAKDEKAKDQKPKDGKGTDKKGTDKKGGR